MPRYQPYNSVTSVTYNFNHGSIEVTSQLVPDLYVPTRCIKHSYIILRIVNIREIRSCFLKVGKIISRKWPYITVSLPEIRLCLLIILRTPGTFNKLHKRSWPKLLGKTQNAHIYLESTCSFRLLVFSSWMWISSSLCFWNIFSFLLFRGFRSGRISWLCVEKCQSSLCIYLKCICLVTSSSADIYHYCCYRKWRQSFLFGALYHPFYPVPVTTIGFLCVM